jgi:hypothetical protein
VDPVTGRRIPERVRLVPCVWINDEGQCNLYRSGEPSSTGKDAHVQPNYLMWRQRQRESDRRPPRQTEPQASSTDRDGEDFAGLGLAVVIIGIFLAIIVGVMS